MLLNTEGLNIDQIDRFRMTGEGYRSFSVGNVALLGYEHSTTTPEIYDGDIASLLLDSPSTAIMHYDEPDIDNGKQSGVMMAINYHDAHSEGDHQIVVQDPHAKEKGQWVLWVPPGSNNKTFYRRSFFRKPHPFEDRPENPNKTSRVFAHIGNADEAIKSFEDAGYSFSDEYLERSLDPDSTYQKLRKLSVANKNLWDAGSRSTTP